MAILKDLTGKQFGKLTVIAHKGKNKSNSHTWLCKCNCGNESIVLGGNLTTGHTTTCGKCYEFKPRKIEDLSGQRFERLVVLSMHGKAKDGTSTWNCICDCGNEVIVHKSKLTKGAKRSCGCLRAESNKTHGLYGTTEHIVWRSMIQRCYDENSSSYDRYGARGITVCDEWRNDFIAFLNHIGHRPSDNHSIDRINSNGNYEPGNVRWATPTEQANNRRSNSMLTLNGETKSASDWGRIYGIKGATIANRKRRGWSDEDAILFPANPQDAKTPQPDIMQTPTEVQPNSPMAGQHTMQHEQMM